MTPQRFWLASALFHAAVIFASTRVAVGWRGSAQCNLPIGAWLLALSRSLTPLALLACGSALVATTAANLEDLAHLRLGAIAGRLLGQAIFGEAILLALVLAVWHQKAACRCRAAVLSGITLGLTVVYVDAYHVEPQMLRVRRYFVDRTGGASRATALRILHISDIHASAIGPHEERALRAGLEHHPDLIVLTGDYVQDDLGRPTEDQTQRDLRALMAAINFEAPLGVFATDGDVGPSCREVFEGTNTRCLVDETAVVMSPGGDTLAITGLSRDHGRGRDPTWFARLTAQGPRTNHRIFISHAPDFVDAVREPADLVLAGHTHGGQVVVPFLGPLRTASRLPRLFAGGLHDYWGIPLHVSRGVGMERAFTVPVRFLCPPEISVLDVRLLPRSEPGQALRATIGEVAGGQSPERQRIDCTRRGLAQGPERRSAATPDRTRPLDRKRTHEIQAFGHLRDPPIALSEHAVRQSVTNMNQVLADTITLGTRRPWATTRPTRRKEFT